MLNKARLVTLMPIKKMDRALKFYTKTLGAKLLYRGQGEMKNFWASVRLADHEIWLTGNDAAEKRTLAYSTFLVKNIRKTVKKLEDAGVKFEAAEKNTEQTEIDGPIATEPFGSSAFFKDTEGNLLMVWQNNPPMD